MTFKDFVSETDWIKTSIEIFFWACSFAIIITYIMVFSHILNSFTDQDIRFVGALAFVLSLMRFVPMVGTPHFYRKGEGVQ